MTDYSEYGELTPQMKELWAKAPAVPADMSAEQFIKLNNDTREATAKTELEALSSQIIIQDFSIPAPDGFKLEARSYRSRSAPAGSQLPLYIHYHGGGFVAGTLSAEDANCARIAVGAPVVVLNVNYRHAPEHVWPTAWNDAEDSFEWAYANAAQLGHDSQRVILGGISAGGHLAASLVQTKHFHHTPSSDSIVGQILLIPVLLNDAGHKQRGTGYPASYKQNEHAPILPKTRIDWFNNLVFPNGHPGDLRANPGLATDEQVKGLPPAVFGIAGADPLRDEALIYAQQLASNGVPTNVHVYKGLPHGFRRFGDQLAEGSKAWDATITDGIRWILEKPKPVEKIKIQVH